MFLQLLPNTWKPKLQDKLKDKGEPDEFDDTYVKPMEGNFTY